MISRGQPPARSCSTAMARRSGLARLRSWLYHTTFYLFVIVTAVVLVGSGWGLIEQALRTGGQKFWNLIIVGGSYAFVFIFSVFIIISRIISVKRALRSMPKPYIPTKRIDVPNKVAKHIATEYTRTAVIAHISQATTGKQEGWGRPGSRFADQHFRTVILDTVPLLERLLAPERKPSTSPFASSNALLSCPYLTVETRIAIKAHLSLIERAKYDVVEPTEEDCETCEKLTAVILVSVLREKAREGHAGESEDLFMQRGFDYAVPEESIAAGDSTSSLAITSTDSELRQRR